VLLFHVGGSQGPYYGGVDLAEPSSLGFGLWLL